MKIYLRINVKLVPEGTLQHYLNILKNKYSVARENHGEKKRRKIKGENLEEKLHLCSFIITFLKRWANRELNKNSEKGTMTNHVHWNDSTTIWRGWWQMKRK